MESGRLTIEALLGAVGVIVTATVFTVAFSNVRLGAHRDHHRAEDRRLQEGLEKGEGAWAAFRLISAHFEAAALDPLAVATVRVTNALSAALAFVVVAYVVSRGTSGWSAAEVSAVAVGPLVQAAVAGLGIQETRALRRSIVSTLNDLLVDIMSYHHPLVDDDRSWFTMHPSRAERAVIDQTFAAACRLKEGRRLPMVGLFQVVAATAAGDWRLARHLADAAVARSPDDPAALSTAAAVYLHAAQAGIEGEDAASLTRTAIAHATRVLDSGQRFDVLGLSRLLARARDLLARLEPSAEHVHDALDAYEIAINFDPENLQTRLNRAYFVEPLHSELAPPLAPIAVEEMWALKMVADLDVVLDAGENVGARELRGVALACVGDWEAAAEEFDVVAARSGWGDGTYRVAALTMAGRHAEAVIGVETIKLRGERAGGDVLAEASFWQAVAGSQLEGASPFVVADALSAAGWTQDRAETIELLVDAGVITRTSALVDGIAVLRPPAAVSERPMSGGLLRLMTASDERSVAHPTDDGVWEPLTT